jgi:hypothetical protein
MLQLERIRSEKKHKAGIGSIWRFYDRHDITFKKTLRAAEQDRPGIAAGRAALKAQQSKLDAPRLVFIDETGARTKMVRTTGVLLAVSALSPVCRTVTGKC